jgi:hypothetical protein
MSSKKVVLSVIAVVGALALVIALFAGSIVGFVFYTIGNSDAAQTAKKFLRQSERLRQDVGDVRDFGYFTTGDIKTQGSMGTAELRIKTIGARRTVNATVDLALHRDRWDVIDAFYTNDSGERVFLTNNFDTDPALTTPTDRHAPADDNTNDRQGTSGAGANRQRPKR